MGSFKDLSAKGRTDAVPALVDLLVTDRSSDVSVEVVPLCISGAGVEGRWGSMAASSLVCEVSKALILSQRAPTCADKSCVRVVLAVVRP